MNRLRYFILTGIFYGYSKEAIHAFIMRCCDVDMGNESEFTPTSTGTQFEHMGFIPSARELAMTVEEVTSDVNSRRICKASFPYDGPSMSSLRRSLRTRRQILKTVSSRC